MNPSKPAMEQQREYCAPDSNAGQHCVRSRVATYGYVPGSANVGSMELPRDRTQTTPLESLLIECSKYLIHMAVDLHR